MLYYHLKDKRRNLLDITNGKLRVLHFNELSPYAGNNEEETNLNLLTTHSEIYFRSLWKNAVS